MAFFPLFIDLAAKNCLIIGGGAVAIRKAETLLQFGAAVTVIGNPSDPGIIELAQTGKINHQARRYRAGDLTGAFLAVAATDDPEVNAQIYREAMEKGIWINVADDPEKCSFIFPAIVQRDQIVVGITSSGIFPALTKKIREKIERELPASLDKAAGALRKARNKVKSTIGNPDQRKAILGDMAQKILNNQSIDWKENIRDESEQSADEQNN
jgi:siroheme synthase-like protein